MTRTDNQDPASGPRPGHLGEQGGQEPDERGGYGGHTGGKDPRQTAENEGEETGRQVEQDRATGQVGAAAPEHGSGSSMTGGRM